jgi:hypothetical protein
MTRVSETFADLGDNLAAISAKSTEFAAGLLQKVAPALSDLTARLANIDAAGFGAKLSDYFQKTLEWIGETFKLKDALNQVEVAIKGITSGNFGDGLKLLFMAGRDAAFNAINQIVAAAQAALQTVGFAFREIFNRDSTTFAYIRGGIEWLAAFISEKIAGGLADVVEAFGRSIPEMMRPIADKMADSFLPGIRFMGEQLQSVINDFDATPVSKALRDAQEKAASASSDYFNLFYYEAGNLKKEWTDVGLAMPKAFADSYKANLENPLFEMKDRTAETAAQMEKVAAATRSAAFDAEKFGKALSDARLDRLTGPVAGSPVPDFKQPGIFGMDPNTLPPVESTDSDGGSGAGGGGGVGSTTRPTTAMDRLREAAGEFNEAAMAEESRIMQRGSRGEERAAELEAQGMNRSAANIRAREERNRQRDAERFERNQAARARQKELEAMSPLDRSKAQQDDRKLAREQEKMAKDASKSEKERERASEAAGGGRSGAQQDPAAQILTFLRDTFFKDFQSRLPQNALS